jgi:hypothetical protein
VAKTQAERKKGIRQKAKVSETFKRSAKKAKGKRKCTNNRRKRKEERRKKKEENPLKDKKKICAFAVNPIVVTLSYACPEGNRRVEVRSS